MWMTFPHLHLMRYTRPGAGLSTLAKRFPHCSQVNFNVASDAGHGVRREHGRPRGVKNTPGLHLGSSCWYGLTRYRGMPGGFGARRAGACGAPVGGVA